MRLNLGHRLEVPMFLAIGAFCMLDICVLLPPLIGAPWCACGVCGYPLLDGFGVCGVCVRGVREGFEVWLHSSVVYGVAKVPSKARFQTS